MRGRGNVTTEVLGEIPAQQAQKLNLFDDEVREIT
jgi:hypothetical protein